MTFRIFWVTKEGLRYRRSLIISQTLKENLELFLEG